MNPLPVTLANVTVAGKYRILLELGQGGTANVYLAVADGPNGFNKLVVLKCLKASLGEDDDFRQMFLNEARLSARLSHPNVVQVLEVTEHAGLPVIVMEYLDGASLSSLRARAGHKLTPNAHVRILTDVLTALHYSHELLDYDGKPLNVVHRDMTPQNVFIAQTGHVKLLDFGIAKLSGSVVETRAGLVKGKLRYMPPEQISGAELDRRADIYASGVMLWEAVAGARMWAGLSDVTIMNRVLAADIPRPSSVRDDVHPTLEAICMRALAPKASERFQTAEELRLELEQFLADAASSVRPREVEELMRDCFSEDRERTRAVIGKQLGHASLSRSFTSGAITPVPMVRDIGEPYPDVPTGVTIQEPISARRKKQTANRRGLFVGLAAGALALLTIGGYSGLSAGGVRGLFERQLQKDSAQSTVRSSEQALKADARVNPTRGSIRLRISALPKDAKLFLDDVGLTGNPALVELLRGEQLHTLVAEAAGYRSESVVVSADEDREIALTLERPAVPLTGALPLSGALPLNGALPLSGAVPLNGALPLSGALSQNNGGARGQVSGAQRADGERGEAYAMSDRQAGNQRIGEAPATQRGDTQRSDTQRGDTQRGDTQRGPDSEPRSEGRSGTHGQGGRGSDRQKATEDKGCAMPFYVDERGIKKLNPACFK